MESWIEDRVCGRPVKTSWQQTGWMLRQEMRVRLPPWWDPKLRLVIRTYQATGRIAMSLERLKVE